MGRILTRYSAVCHYPSLAGRTVRLACIRRTASVRPEPGSNSRKNTGSLNPACFPENRITKDTGRFPSTIPLLRCANYSPAFRPAGNYYRSWPQKVKGQLPGPPSLRLHLGSAHRPGNRPVPSRVAACSANSLATLCQTNSASTATSCDASSASHRSGSCFASFKYPSRMRR